MTICVLFSYLYALSGSLSARTLGIVTCIISIFIICGITQADEVREHFITTNEGDTLRLIELIDDSGDTFIPDSSYCQIDSNVYMTYISTYDTLDIPQGQVLVLIILGDFVWPSRINDLRVE